MQIIFELMANLFFRLPWFYRGWGILFFKDYRRKVLIDWEEMDPLAVKIDMVLIIT